MTIPYEIQRIESIEGNDRTTFATNEVKVHGTLKGGNPAATGLAIHSSTEITKETLGLTDWKSALQ